MVCNLLFYYALINDLGLPCTIFQLFANKSIFNIFIAKVSTCHSACFFLPLLPFFLRGGGGGGVFLNDALQLQVSNDRLADRQCLKKILKQRFYLHQFRFMIH